MLLLLTKVAGWTRNFQPHRKERDFERKESDLESQS